MWLPRALDDWMVFVSTPLNVEIFFRTLCMCWASLVAQWLGVCLPMQGTRVRALVREDPTCRELTKPVCHNY